MGLMVRRHKRADAEGSTGALVHCKGGTSPKKPPSGRQVSQDTWWWACSHLMRSIQ